MAEFNKEFEVAKVVAVIQESFGPAVSLTVTEESHNVYRVTARADTDADLDAGRRSLAARAGGK